MNLTKYYKHAPDTAQTGEWFGHSGFNSGYLTIMLGSKMGGNGVAIMLNIAPEDMSGDVPQWGSSCASSTASRMRKGGDRSGDLPPHQATRERDARPELYGPGPNHRESNGFVKADRNQA